MERVRRLMDIGDARYADGDYDRQRAHTARVSIFSKVSDSSPIPRRHSSTPHGSPTARLTLSPLAEVIPSDTLESVLRRPGLLPRA